ncbi:MAG: sulfite exporter TauE/SafE family protein [Elusimicrobia bacterium]|nr:sulfite exporter TauE/SafE family protein [Elusimicrobiota bacterium]
MENTAILATAASLGLIHTVLGPDHYIPFAALSQARGWSDSKTALITVLCGVGHVASSVLIGLAGIALGSAVSRLEWLEGLRGDLAGWLLLCFGLAYMLWGVKHALRGRRHAHVHSHADEGPHAHEHAHQALHAHPHGEESSVTPWALFIVFVFGPCEPLIPVLMYPAMKTGLGLAMAAAAVFSAATLAAMLVCVFLLLRGLSSVPAQRLERYAHALAGFAIFACGVAVKAGL